MDLYSNFSKKDIINQSVIADMVNQFLFHNFRQKKKLSSLQLMKNQKNLK